MKKQLTKQFNEIYKIAKQKEDVLLMLHTIMEARKLGITLEDTEKSEPNGLEPEGVLEGHMSDIDEIISSLIEAANQAEDSSESEPSQDEEVENFLVMKVDNKTLKISENKIPALIQYNELTSDEAERLYLLSEECGEVIQAIGKILRHGYEAYSPFDETQTTNRESLERELGDISAALKLLIDAEDLNEKSIQDSYSNKLNNVKQYLHHQEDL